MKKSTELQEALKVTKPIFCFYCEKPLKNFQALHAHLRFCPKRKHYKNFFLKVMVKKFAFLRKIL